jgi:hypothetical protein
MVKKALKKTSKVLGGLGAAYVLSDALGPKVTGVDPEVEAADREATRKRVEENRVDRPPAPEPVQSRIRLRDPNEHYVREDTSGSRMRPPPLFGLERYEKTAMKKGGAVSASRRADGIAQRGKTRGKMY